VAGVTDEGARVTTKAAVVAAVAWVLSTATVSVAVPVVVERASVSAQVFGDTYTVYPGLRVDTESFRRRIERLGYDSVGGTPSRPGSSCPGISKRCR
jgi:hypothetical protein